MVFLLWWLGVFLPVAHANPPSVPLPEWVRQKPPGNQVHKFYVGRSAPRKNEKDALREAIEDASLQAIKENFGVELTLDSESLETLSDVKLSKRLSEKSESVRLLGFETEQNEIRENSGDFTAYVLCRYPVKEIQDEKARLKREIRARNSDLPVHEVGEDAPGKNKGTLEIHTIPPGAEVKVDHRSWGLTPIRIRGVLEPGEHWVDLIHPDYEPELNQKVTIHPGQTTIHRETLKRKEIRLKLQTEPSDAIVMVNGHPHRGTTPTKIKAFHGDTLTISFSHPEVNEFSTQVRVLDGLELPVFNLVHKSARILLDSFPSGADVYLDSKKVGKTGDSQGFTVTKGEHVVLLRKKGFVDEDFEVRVKGGETKIVPTKRLTSESEEEIRKKKEREKEQRRREAEREEDRRLRQQEREEEERERAIRIEESRREDARREAEIDSEYSSRYVYYGLGYGGAPNSIPLQDSNRSFCCLLNSLGIQKRIIRTAYLRAEYSLGLGKDYEPRSPDSQYSFSSGTDETLVSHDLNVGIPYYFANQIYFAPEAGLYFSQRTKSQGKFRQDYFGISLGFDPILRQQGVGMLIRYRKYSDAGSYSGGEHFSFLIVLGNLWEG